VLQLTAMKKTLLITYCILSLLSLQAQKREEGFDFYFKPAKYVPRYYVVTEKKDTGWFRQAWYLPEGTLAMEAWYKDSAATIPHGKESWYHASRYMKSTGSYANGKKEGPWLKYNEQGRITDTAFYVNGHRKGISFGFNNEGYLIDSSNFDGAGNGVEINWYNEGTVSSAGRWINDTAKHGRWQYFHANGKLRAIEDYKNGERINCLCYDEQEQLLDSALCIEREATFPGREQGWRSFLEKNLDAAVPVRKGAPLGYYTVMVQFIVETDGSLSGIRPLTKYGYGMEEEVLRILKRSPKWEPAFQFGSKVKAYRRQPVTFAVSQR